MAFRGVVTEMDRWEPARWQAAITKREDVRETGETDVQRPQKVIDGDRFVLKDKTREVQFLFSGGGTRRAMDMCGCRRSGCFVREMLR
jgi:hypothetical protein